VLPSGGVRRAGRLEVALPDSKQHYPHLSVLCLPMLQIIGIIALFLSSGCIPAPSSPATLTRTRYAPACSRCVIWSTRVLRKTTRV